MSVYLQDGDLTLHHGDAATVLADLPEGSVDCVVTSPPYFGLRDYGVECQIGLEPTPEEYVAAMVGVFREVWRVLAPWGTCWVNIGDSYAANASGGLTGSTLTKGGRQTPHNRVRRGRVDVKHKDLLMMPARLALALQADGWWVRSRIVWAKPNPMPESVTDRPTSAHEDVYLLTKAPRYYYDAEAVREPHTAGNLQRQLSQPKDRGDSRGFKFATTQRYLHPAGRNLRNVWSIATEPTPEAHFATFPTELVRRCLAAGCKPGGTVLDPFIGSGTTGLVARRMGLNCIGIDASAEYLGIAAKRLQQLSLLGGAA